MRTLTKTLLFTLLGPAVASAQTTRITVPDAVGQGNAASDGLSVSGDGSRVAYYSAASNLVPGDTNGFIDCFVTAYPSRVTTCVSLTLSGVTGNGPSAETLSYGQPALSGNGRYVAFTSLATNLAGGFDTNNTSDVFLRDLETGTTTRVTTAISGSPNGAALTRAGAVSLDGRFVVYESIANNVVAGDTNNTWDVFVRDMVAGTTERASVASNGAQANSFSMHGSISADGRYVLFQSFASNLGNEVNGEFDVFLRDRQLGTTTLVSAGPVPGQGTVYFGGLEPAMSSDARHVAFRTTANIAPGDTAFDADVYVKTLATGQFDRISVTTAGLPGTGGTASFQPSLSLDGRYVGFATNRVFVPEDTNAANDVYLRDRLLATTTRLSVSSAGGQGDGTSGSVQIASCGAVAVFTSSATNLVAGDSNAADDGFVRALAPPNDECATATAISGPGSFPFHALLATTGVGGQQDAGCGPGMPRDLWFAWTSTFTGTAVVDTCLSSGDTKVAVRGGGCPPAPVIACNDDGCGATGGGAIVRFQAVQGSTYAIQVATASGDGTGLLRIAIPLPVDDCGAPVVIAGAGPFQYDTTNATTGAEGQVDSGCGPGILKDVWFAWTAPYSGEAVITTCQTLSSATKVAVYAGTACPLGPPLACNDDGCSGDAAAVCFPVVAGAGYLIQLGSEFFVGGPREFEIWNAGPAITDPCAPLDNGVTTTAVSSGASMVWIQRFGDVGGSTTVTEISTAWGSALSPPSANPIDGAPGRVAIWDDPDEDGEPDDAILLRFVDVAITGSGTDAFQVVPLVPPVTVSGRYFVGAGTGVPSNVYPAPLSRAATCSGWDRAWVASASQGPVDWAVLSANSLPPSRVEDFGLIGQFLLRPTCSATVPFVLFCPGDGTGTACPCANSSAVGASEGCFNSLGIGGRLRAIGTPSVAADTLTLVGAQMPNGSALYYQGTAQQNGGAGAVFGDGLRCTGGTVIRLGTRTNVAGVSQLPGPGDPSISTSGTVTVGATRMYQIWYRNSASFCTTSTFNLTNGLQTTWQP